jgi:hypothetical protein
LGSTAGPHSDPAAALPGLIDDVDVHDVEPAAAAKDERSAGRSNGTQSAGM